MDDSKVLYMTSRRPCCSQCWVSIHSTFSILTEWSNIFEWFWNLTKWQITKGVLDWCL